MNVKKITLTITVLIVFLGAILIYSWVMSFTHLGINSEDRAFISSISEHLQEQGDVVSWSEILPQNWKKVCFVTEYIKTSRLLAENENISSNNIQFATGFDLVGNGGIWGISFFAPPDIAYVFSIPSSYYAPQNSGCLSRDLAYVQLQASRLNKNIKTLKLISDGEKKYD